MIKKLFRSPTFLVSSLMILPVVSAAHSDHPEAVSAGWLSNGMTQSVTVGVVMAVILVGVVMWLWRHRVTKTMVTTTLVAVVLVGGVIGLAITTEQHTPEVTADFTGLTDTVVTLHKDPTCGCCEGYAAALREQGFVVTVKETSELEAIKADHNIPVTGASCHTTEIGDYVVEGHVPLSAVAQLLEEQPDIAGIGLPGMPIGTPGMPGAKRGPYEVYQLSADGAMTPYVTI